MPKTRGSEAAQDLALSKQKIMHSPPTEPRTGWSNQLDGDPGERDQDRNLHIQSNV